MGSREFFLSVENFLARSRIFYLSRIFFFPVENCSAGREFFCRFICWDHMLGMQRAFSRQNSTRGINNMASSDGNSAGNMLRQILGRIGDLSAAIDQQGSSLSRGRAPITTLVESEVRKVFGADHQAPSSTSSASYPAVSASQSGPLYPMWRNFTNFRTANCRSSRGGKRKGATRFERGPPKISKRSCRYSTNLGFSEPVLSIRVNKSCKDKKKFSKSSCASATLNFNSGKSGRGKTPNAECRTPNAECTVCLRLVSLVFACG